MPFYPGQGDCLLVAPRTPRGYAPPLSSYHREELPAFDRTRSDRIYRVYIFLDVPLQERPILARFPGADYAVSFSTSGDCVIVKKYAWTDDLAGAYLDTLRQAVAVHIGGGPPVYYRTRLDGWYLKQTGTRYQLGVLPKNQHLKIKDLPNVPSVSRPERNELVEITLTPQELLPLDTLWQSVDPVLSFIHKRVSYTFQLATSPASLLEELVQFMDPIKNYTFIPGKTKIPDKDPMHVGFRFHQME